MVSTAGRVLKSSEVEVEGKFSLDLAGIVPPGPNGKHPAQTSGAPAKVRVLENQKEFAVMEVTCSCGRKTIIRCDYGEKVCEQKPQ
ncbi:MAG: hypothetical protein ABSH16_13960 [Sedimentisphaerales bacterium]